MRQAIYEPLSAALCSARNQSNNTMNTTLTFTSTLRASFVEPADSDAEIAIHLGNDSWGGIVLLTGLTRDAIERCGAKSETCMLLAQELERCAQLIRRAAAETKPSSSSDW